MLSDSDAVQAADLQRRRVLSAFTVGDAADPVSLARRPNRPLIGGVALTVLASLGTGIGTLLTDDVPKDWAREGNVVVRQSSAERFLSTGGELRPVRNDTSLALAGLPSPRTVKVDEVRFTTRPVGPAVGITGAPAQRPQVPADEVPWWACQQTGQPLAVLTGGGPTTGGRALLAAVGEPASLLLVADGVAHPVTAEVAQALGYDPAAARALPPAFAALLVGGAPLQRLPAPAPAPPPPVQPSPAVPPGTAPLPAPAPIPAPAFLTAGTLLQDTGDDALYVADAGQLRPVAGPTALRLLYGGPAPAPVRISADELRQVPEGPALEVPDFPASPPPVTAAGTIVCISTAGGVVAEEATLPTLGLQPGPAAQDPTRATVWQPPGVAALVRPDSSIRAAVTSADPLLLVADGQSFPVPEEAALGALGYTGEQVRPRPAAWLALIGRGPALVPLRLGQPEDGLGGAQRPAG